MGQQHKLLKWVAGECHSCLHLAGHSGVCYKTLHHMTHWLNYLDVGFYFLAGNLTWNDITGGVDQNPRTEEVL